MALKITRGGLSLSPTTLTGMFGGNTGEGFLCHCSQTLELPPTGSQAGPILAAFPQAGKDLSRQAGFALMTGSLKGIFKWIVMLCGFKCVLVLILFTLSNITLI